jgi:ABC-type branched-subunit amino acid transport system permease subunit
MAVSYVSRRTTLSVALMVVATIVAFLLPSSTQLSFATAVVVDIAIVALVALAVPGLRTDHPVLFRSMLSLFIVDAALFGSYFFSATTNYNLAIGAAMAIVLLGLSFLTGASGQISIGNGAFMGVGAFAMGIWANHHATTPIVITLIIAIVAGALVGLMLGLPATRLRGPYLAGMTLAFAVAFTAIVNSFHSWTGGDSGLQLPTSVTPPQWLANFFNSSTSLLTINSMWLADITIVVTGVAFFFMANLFASRTGRAMRLIRDNDVAAELVGISLPRTRVIAFVVSSAYAALGGACGRSSTIRSHHPRIPSRCQSPFSRWWSLAASVPFRAL